MFVRAELDVAHGYFNSELHGAYDCGPHGARARGGQDGAETAFHLQSGGCSERRLRWVQRRYAERMSPQTSSA